MLALGALAAVLVWDEAGRDFRTITQSPAEQATWAAATLSMAFTGYFLGRVLLYPFGGPFAGPSHYSLSSEGLLYGGYLFPWQAFSHYSIEPESQILTLWSENSPGNVGFALRPFSKLERERLRSHVSNWVSSQAVKNGSKSRWAPISRMTFLASTAVGLGALLLALFGIRALIGITLILYVFMKVGGDLMMKSAFGGLAHKIDD